jgi:TonB-linked SusC/RagA family outer membrane protein
MKFFKSKFMRIMRLTIVIITIALMQVSAAGLAQKVSLKFNNVPLEQVLIAVKQQTAYNFVYTEDVIAKAKRVSINLKDADLKDALFFCFQNQPLSFTIDQSTIVVKEKEPTFLDRLAERWAAIDVTGKVLDEEGQPLVGATVKVKGLNKFTKTNAKGEFFLEGLNENAILEISFIGYVMKEVKVAGNLGKLQLVLAEAKLEEVMVNAGYYTVKDSERTGSIARITSKDIEKQPVTNFLATMQGRMAGVSITQTTGVPGGGFNIRIRGQNSLRSDGNDPFYVIDGVPYSSDAIASGTTTNVFAGRLSPLNTINPDQIESIEVLKDADATAIYGSRGANGVILITTKKGKAGKTVVSGQAAYGVSHVARFRDLMNTQQYLEMRNEALANDGLTKFEYYEYDANGIWDQNRYTDWQEELLGGTARYTNLQSSVSGGSAQTQFLLSANYNKQTTVFIGDFNYKKGNVHLSLNHESLDKKFRANLSTGYTIQDNNQPYIDLTNQVMGIAPNAPALFDENGNLNWENNTFNNPARWLNGKNLANTYDLISNLVLSYQIVNGLELKSNFGFTTLHHNGTNTAPNTMQNPSFGSGSESSTIYFARSARKSWIVEPQLSWKRQIGPGKFELLFGGTFQDRKGSQFNQYGRGFSSNSLIYSLAAASSVTTELDEESVYKYQAFFVRANYNLKDKYIVNVTGRRDGSSRFGPGKQFAKFGAVGAAWLFSKESIFKNQDLLSFGKFRVSYGMTGNDQIGDYQYLDTYQSTGVNYQNIIGLRPTRLFNANFAWESNKKFEMAMETGFFQDRIFLTAAWYSNRSSNQLVGIPLSATTGFSSLTANLDATVKNTGTEFTLRTVNVQQNGFQWSTDLNLSISRNELLSFPNLQNSTYRNTYVIGQPLNIKKLYNFTGINQETGLYQFEDVNKDGRISSPDDKGMVVDFNPKYFGGLQNQFSYRNWRLDFLLQFVKQLNYKLSVHYAGSGINQSVEVLDRWKNSGNVATYQKYTTGVNAAVMDAAARYEESTGAVQDASYIRLKNISLGYTVPKRWIKNVQSQLSLQGQNVLTFARHKNGDPEFGSVGYLPPLRVLSVNLQFTF